MVFRLPHQTAPGEPRRSWLSASRKSKGELLSLRQGLSISSRVADRPFQEMILDAIEDARLIRVRAGVSLRWSLADAAAPTTRRPSTRIE